MHRSLSLIVVALAACTGSGEVPTSSATDPTVEFEIQVPDVDTGWPDTESDVDTDTDTDADTDADTDTDTSDTDDTDVVDTDTDTDVADTDTDVVDTDVVDTDVVDTDVVDTDVDTDVSTACLTFTAEVRKKSDGSSCTGITTGVCTAADDLLMVGIVANTCDVAETFDTSNGCLADQFTIGSDTRGPICTSSVTSWTIPAADTDEAVEDWSGGLAAGAYTLEVRFPTVGTATTDSVAFVILP